MTLQLSLLEGTNGFHHPSGVGVVILLQEMENSRKKLTTRTWHLGETSTNGSGLETSAIYSPTIHIGDALVKHDRRDKWIVGLARVGEQALRLISARHRFFLGQTRRRI